jgi:type IV pilus assembly protein PilM
MIRDVFIPTKVKNNYLFAQRIIGFDIGKMHVYATQVYFKGTKIIVEKFFDEPLTQSTQADYAERVTQAIKNVLAKVDRYDVLCTSINSSQVIFKEIRLPFVQYEKIKMVVEYEVEPLLPFSLNDAIIDFIITKSIPQEQSSEVLVAAVQNQHVAQHLAYFEHAGVSPAQVTVDMFGLYDLYRRIPSYASLTGGVAIIDLGVYSTRIAYIQDGQLRFIRAIPKGMSNQVKNISDTLSLPQNEVMENLVRFGFEKDHDATYSQAVTKALTSFWYEISFTLQSFTGSLAPEQAVTKILLLGEGAEIKGLINFVSSTLHIPCQVFQATELVSQGALTLKTRNQIPLANIMSLGTVLSCAADGQFNLRQKQFAISDDNTVNKQIIIALVLLFCILTALGVHSFVQIRKFSNELQASQAQMIKELKDRFPRTPENYTKIEDILDYVKLEVNNQEKTWYAFSSQARSSFLKYLLELTSRLDKQNLGLVVEKVSIADDILTLKAHVKSNEDVTRLWRDLKQSKIFTNIEQPLDTEFTMKITLSPNGEES